MGDVRRLKNNVALTYLSEKGINKNPNDPRLVYLYQISTTLPRILEVELVMVISSVVLF